MQKCGLGGSSAKGTRMEAPTGWCLGGGIPLPGEGGVWGGGCAPSPEKFLYFLLRNVAF